MPWEGGVSWGRYGPWEALGGAGEVRTLLRVLRAGWARLEASSGAPDRERAQGAFPLRCDATRSDIAPVGSGGSPKIHLNSTPLLTALTMLTIVNDIDISNSRANRITGIQ